MNDAALCIYAWDFADEGVEPVLAAVADLGVTSLYFASVYHAGWFVLPHNPRRTCYMPEDGVVYFHALPRFFEDTPLKPRVARIAADVDWVASVGKCQDRFGLRMTSWTVCNHNTRLGIAHPEYTVRNALGDSYPHALTPASPAVRAYCRGLAQNLASQYPLQSIFLEAIGYEGRRHGHHHERELTPFGPLENALLDISFSQFDIAAAESRGIDGESVRRAVAAHLTAYLDSVPDVARGMPRTLAQFYEHCPRLIDYCRALDDVVASLVKEIRTDVIPYRVALEGLQSLATYDWRVVGAYGATPTRVGEITRAACAEAPAAQHVRTGFCLGSYPPETDGVIDSLQRCCECVRAAIEAGAEGLFFYNYSESPRTCLSWIKPALRDVISNRCSA